MLIINQDRDKIINFENMDEIYVQNPLKNNDGEFEIRAENTGIDVQIGCYKTESRAKEVLKEIISWVENKCDFSMDRDGFQVTRQSDVFYMPEE